MCHHVRFSYHLLSKREKGKARDSPLVQDGNEELVMTHWRSCDQGQTGQLHILPSRWAGAVPGPCLARLALQPVSVSSSQSHTSGIRFQHLLDIFVLTSTFCCRRKSNQPAQQLSVQSSLFDSHQLPVLPRHIHSFSREV